MPHQAFGKLSEARTKDLPLAMQISDGPKLIGRDIPASAYFVDTQIAGKVVKSLVDTGACVTVMSERVFGGLPDFKLEPAPEGMRSFEGVVQGSELKVMGVAHIPIKIGNFMSGPHPVIVVPGTRTELILGLDFLDRYSISVDTCNRQLRIGGPGKPISYVDVKPQLASSSSYKVIVPKSTEIPPRTTKHVPVVVKGLLEDVDGCIEGLDIENPNFLVARSVNFIQSGKTEVICTNVSGTPVVLHPK